MIYFFKKDKIYYCVKANKLLTSATLDKLNWLFTGELIEATSIEGHFIGPRIEMVSPWSTNAVEIAKNMGINSLVRVEKFTKIKDKNTQFDKMLEARFDKLHKNIFDTTKTKEPIKYIKDIDAYNLNEGLALSDDEVTYLIKLSKEQNRYLTDTEVFGFSQVNSEHCRHKIFNGEFIIDNESKTQSLFSLIKQTSKRNKNYIVSAYKDNCAFILGPKATQFAPQKTGIANFFTQKPIETYISLKAETHNFPTTVEPFNGAATGTGGEIRDRMAGGQASIPLAGTAVYMTSYARNGKNRTFEKHTTPRNWLYQSPAQILQKASDGASDFGNKFGQPLICGSVLTFEHLEAKQFWGFDKVIMLAGGIGFTEKNQVYKKTPKRGDAIILLGGSNYRIGIGGGSVSSVNTGDLLDDLELNAIQRSNPEMQKRVFNVIRTISESNVNKIISIHDHGAGGHQNCLAELVEDTGGSIYLENLPLGDKTLSLKELICNESQERMGLIVRKEDIPHLKKIAERERAPFYVIGKVRDDKKLLFIDRKTKEKPIDLHSNNYFDTPLNTVIKDTSKDRKFASFSWNENKIRKYVEDVLQLEAVACKDWLTNKVDRSVGGKVALQQCTGTLQLPLNNLGISAIDYTSKKGIATAIGSAPITALIDAQKGSRLAVAESLTNLIWTPLTYGLKGVSLSANWMWPCKNTGDDARLYQAVESISRFCIELGINIPTGKDSLSMTQHYPNREKVLAPGTVIVSAVAECADFTKSISPTLKTLRDTEILYIDLSKDTYKLDGSSFAQLLGKIGTKAPDVKDTSYFIKAFKLMQKFIAQGRILAGHDVSSGGLITTLLEMCFSNPELGANIDLSSIDCDSLVKLLFSEQPSVVIQAYKNDTLRDELKKDKISFHTIGNLGAKNIFNIKFKDIKLSFQISKIRDIWYKSSYYFDEKQCGKKLAQKRYNNYKKQPLLFTFPENFKGTFSSLNIHPLRKTKSKIKAAIIREKGINGEREMAWAMYLAGMEVKDIHMTDLISGRENLSDIRFIVFTGGFSNSDVLGSAKGWAGAFLYNKKANNCLQSFYERSDTLSLGVCNGCQLMIHLDLLGYGDSVRMKKNTSQKFESAFVNVDILENNSIMLKNLVGSRLGVWVAHAEGRFCLRQDENNYHIPMKYSYKDYPGLVNGSDYGLAGLSSADGRHLALMPHIERAIYPWNWGYYPQDRIHKDEVSPWILSFINAKKWLENNY